MNLANNLAIAQYPADPSAPESAVSFVTDQVDGVCSSPEEGWNLKSGATAVRAISCLVQPMAGDTVLVVLEEETSYILSILHRQAQAPLTICASEDQGINLKTKFLSVISQQSISLQALTDFDIKAPFGALKTNSANLFQSVRGSLVTTAKNWVSSTDDYQLNAKGSMITRAKVQIINADDDLFVDAERINMG